MENYKILALDETGKASFNHLSKNFILSGLIVSEESKKEFNESIIEIKKKYFNNDKIVFHCRDILRKKGPFKILRENSLKELNFWSDFIKILSSDFLSIAIVITDKDKAKKLGWNDIAILRRSYNKMLEEFVKKHLIESNGKIIAESEPYQDKYLIEAHNKMQSIGIPSEGITGFSYRKKVTSLSLVNKFNLDIDIQTADSLAIMGNIVYNLKMNKNDNLTGVQLLMKKLIINKLNNKDNPGIFEILT